MILISMIKNMTENLLLLGRIKYDLESLGAGVGMVSLATIQSRPPHACEASNGYSLLFISLPAPKHTHIVQRQLVGKDQEFLN